MILTAALVINTYLWVHDDICNIQVSVCMYVYIHTAIWMDECVCVCTCLNHKTSSKPISFKQINWLYSPEWWVKFAARRCRTVEFLWEWFAERRLYVKTGQVWKNTMHMNTSHGHTNTSHSHMNTSHGHMNTSHMKSYEHKPHKNKSLSHEHKSLSHEHKSQPHEHTTQVTVTWTQVIVTKTSPPTTSQHLFIDTTTAISMHLAYYQWKYRPVKPVTLSELTYWPQYKISVFHCCKTAFNWLNLKLTIQQAAINN